MIKKTKICILTCLLVLCTGCIKQPVSSKQEPLSSSEQVSLNVPADYQYKSNHLEINLILNIPDSLHLVRTDAHKIALGQYAAQSKEILLPGDNWTYTHYDQEDGQYLDEEGKNIAFSEWRNPSSDVFSPYLVVSDRSIVGVFEDPLTNGQLSFSEKVENSFRYEEFTDIYPSDTPYNADAYSRTKELSFSSPKDVLNTCLKQLQQMGIPLTDIQSECFTLTKDVMEQEFVYSSGNDQITNYDPGWKETDNGYYIFARQALQDLPVFYYNGFFSDLPVNTIGRETCPIRILYAESGLISLDIEKIFEFTEDQGESLSLVPFKSIMETVINRYNEVLTDSSYEISKGGLYYYAQKKENDRYEMIPAWIFQVTEKYTESDAFQNTSQSLYMINAETGKEMEYEE